MRLPPVKSSISTDAAVFTFLSSFFFSPPDANMHVWELRGLRVMSASWNSSTRPPPVVASSGCSWRLFYERQHKSRCCISHQIILFPCFFFFSFSPLASLYEGIVKWDAPAERERERKHRVAMLHRPHNQSTSPLLLLLFSPHFYSVSRQLLVPGLICLLWKGAAHNKPTQTTIK